MKNFFEQNRHRIFSGTVGVGSTAVASAAVVTGYCLKPDEFMNFISNHIIATTFIGAGALLVIAALMYLAYRQSKRREEGDYDYHYLSSNDHLKTQIDHDEDYPTLIDSPSGLPQGLTLTPTTSGRWQNFDSFRSA